MPLKNSKLLRRKKSRLSSFSERLIRCFGAAGGKVARPSPCLLYLENIV